MTLAKSRGLPAPANIPIGAKLLSSPHGSFRLFVWRNIHDAAPELLSLFLTVFACFFKLFNVIYKGIIEIENSHKRRRT